MQIRPFRPTDGMSAGVGRHSGGNRVSASPAWTNTRATHVWRRECGLLAALAFADATTVAPCAIEVR
jgi:hypothetical protein